MLKIYKILIEIIQLYIRKDAIVKIHNAKNFIVNAIVKAKAVSIAIVKVVKTKKIKFLRKNKKQAIRFCRLKMIKIKSRWF